MCDKISEGQGMKPEETASRSNAQQALTIVEVPEWTKPMQRNQRFVLLGSCFAQYMGKRFQEEGMNAVCNPLGAAYNPESIRIQVHAALESEKLKSLKVEKEHSSPFHLFNSSIFNFDGKWRCWWANTLLSDTDEARFRETIQRTFSELGEALRQADWLFITLGTNVCYKIKVQKFNSSKVEKEEPSPFHLFNSSISDFDGMIVTNCHKVPDKYFEEVRLDTEACTETLCGMIELLQKECPKLNVVFTVSPYRYKKYGFHGSQLAKATLLLAVDEVCKRFPEKAGYFPAYEIMMDELRDYRFYADDMIHPAPEAVEHIYGKLRIKSSWML